MLLYSTLDLNTVPLLRRLFCRRLFTIVMILIAAAAAAAHILLRRLDEGVERGQPRHNVNKHVGLDQLFELEMAGGPVGQAAGRVQVRVEEDKVSALPADQLLGQSTAAKTGKYNIIFYG
jgi:hypothetical protein